MGTGTNQIATLGDVNRLRKKSVVTNATTIDKLATLAEVSNIEGLYINSSYA